jgi:hypothetical protein
MLTFKHPVSDGQDISVKDRALSVSSFLANQGGVCQQAHPSSQESHLGTMLH